MFGWKKKKALVLTRFAEARPRTFNTLLCDGVSARNLETFAELQRVYEQLQRERPECRILASLDGLDQAAYTSGHATDAFDLDPIDGPDAGIFEEAIQESEASGYVDAPAALATRLANLCAKSVEWTSALGLLDWETAGDANDLVTVNGDPENALRLKDEKEILFQFVGVAHAADMIAAFPNGYFNEDLNPMQTHAIARHLEDAFGLGLFGIGSRFLGFCRAVPLEEETATALTSFLVSLYAKVPQGAAAKLARLLVGRDWLLIRYTES